MSGFSSGWSAPTRKSWSQARGIDKGIEPAAPIRGFGVADVRDKKAPDVRRWREAPPHHGELALPLLTKADNRGQRVGEYAGQRRQIAG